MKKLIIFTSILLLCLTSSFVYAEDSTEVDYDLTTMSSTMVFSQVFDIVYNPMDYVGKSIKIKGLFESYHIEDDGSYMYFIVINDALGCCPQGIEVQFPDDISPPDDQSNVLLDGVFETDQQGAMTYVMLKIKNIQTI